MIDGIFQTAAHLNVWKIHFTVNPPDGTAILLSNALARKCRLSTLSELESSTPCCRPDPVQHVVLLTWWLNPNRMEASHRQDQGRKSRSCSQRWLCEASYCFVLDRREQRLHVRLEGLEYIFEWANHNRKRKSLWCSVKKIKRKQGPSYFSQGRAAGTMKL